MKTIPLLEHYPQCPLLQLEDISVALPQNALTLLPLTSSPSAGAFSPPGCAPGVAQTGAPRLDRTPGSKAPGSPRQTGRPRDTRCGSGSTAPCSYKWEKITTTRLTSSNKVCTLYLLVIHFRVDQLTALVHRCIKSSKPPEGTRSPVSPLF